MVDWLYAQTPASLFLTSINLVELLAGIDTMPQGKRRDAMAQALSIHLSTLFENRVLRFDARAAHSFGACLAVAQAQGNPVGFADYAIAAIAKSQGLMVATRNMQDFQSTGVELINPWAASQF